MIPFIDNKNFTTTMTILINDEIFHKETIGLGNYRLNKKVDIDNPVNIEIFFDNYQILPHPDSRPTVMYMNQIGFVQ